MSNDAYKSTLSKKLEDKFGPGFGEIRGQGEWLRIKCPTCTAHNSKKFRRYVSRHSYKTNCFICNKPIDLRDIFGGYISLPTPALYEDSEEEKKPVNPLSLTLPYSYAKGLHELPPDHPAVKIFTDDQLYDLERYTNENGIVWVPYDGGKVIINGSIFVTSSEHLVFPVYSEGKLVGWQLRSVPGTFYGDQPKALRYFHLFNKGDYLYNFDNAKKFDRVIVVEGVKKALKFPNAVATWGSGISRQQLQLLQKNWKEIVILLDADKHDQTQAKAREITEGLNEGNQCRAINIDLEKYADGRPALSPDDLPAEVLEIIVNAEWNEQNNQQITGI